MSVQTVLGPIAASDLGITLTHEHLALSFEGFYVKPAENLQQYIEGKIVLKNAGFVRQYPYSSRYNVDFRDADSREAVFTDVALFKQFGGSTIVENSSHGLSQGYELLYDVSRQPGVNIVAGTGFYLSMIQKPNLLTLSQEQMHDIITKDLQEGHAVRDAVVRCGFIGEVGSDWPISEFEKNAIRATAAAQQSLKVGVSFHPARNVEAPFEIMRIFLEAGGDVNKCVMSHLDRTLLHDREKLLEFAALGCYSQFDLFGVECSYYQLNPAFDMPSDGQRLNRIVDMVGEGLQEKILVSHDIHTKHRLTSFGGHGYHHVHVNVLPRLLAKGLSQDVIDQIIVKNPAKWLSVD